MLNRRKLITGLISFVTAPAIVKANNLIPVKVMDSFDPKEVFRIKLMNNYGYLDFRLLYYGDDPFTEIIANSCGMKIIKINREDFYI